MATEIDDLNIEIAQLRNNNIALSKQVADLLKIVPKSAKAELVLKATKAEAKAEVLLADAKKFRDLAELKSDAIGGIDEVGGIGEIKPNP